MTLPFGKMTMDGSTLATIRTLLEDLNEAGVVVQLVIEGYNTSLVVEGKSENYNITGLDGVLKRAEELNTELRKHYGQLGGYDV